MIYPDFGVFTREKGQMANPVVAWGTARWFPSSSDTLVTRWFPILLELPGVRCEDWTWATLEIKLPRSGFHVVALVNKLTNPIGVPF